MADVNEAPDSLLLQGNRIAAGARAGATVGWLLAHDPDSFNRFRFTLDDDVGGRFRINATTGAISVPSGAVLEHQNGGYQIQARVQDGDGLSLSGTFTVDVRTAASPSRDTAKVASDALPTDNAANPGGTTVRIRNFGWNDLFVMTGEIYGVNGDDVISFGKNGLDLSTGRADLPVADGSSIRALEYDGQFQTDSIGHHAYSLTGWQVGLPEALVLI